MTGDHAARPRRHRGRLVGKVHGEAGQVVLLEEFLEGPEAGVFAVTDSRAVLPLAPARDHSGSATATPGPTPAAWAPPRAPARRRRRPVVGRSAGPSGADHRRAGPRGSPLPGPAVRGLTLTPAGPRVLEFDCRFGDPETQVILPRMTSDLADLAWAAAGAPCRAARSPRTPGRTSTVLLAARRLPRLLPRTVPRGSTACRRPRPGPASILPRRTGARPGRPGPHPGGRVLGGHRHVGDDLADARARAYSRDLVRFGGSPLRRDVAASPA